MTDQLQSTKQLPSVKVIGRAGSAAAYKIRDYLQRSDVGEGAMSVTFVHRYLADG